MRVDRPSSPCNILIKKTNVVRSEVVHSLRVPLQFNRQLMNLLDEFKGLSIEVEGSAVTTNTKCCALTRGRRKCKNYSMIGYTICYAHRFHF